MMNNCRYCNRYGRACGRSHDTATAADWTRTWNGHAAAVDTPTTDLAPGDRVQLPGPGVLRVVDRVVQSDYVNSSNEPIFYVFWEEGPTENWSAGNSGIAESLWKVVQS
jgi:hypothetical protein